MHAKVKEARDTINNTINNKIGTSADGRANNTLFGFASTQVKSIQRGLTTTTVTSFPTNVTIAAVNTAKAFVRANGRAQTDRVYNGGGITARLTSSTNLELDSGFTYTIDMSPYIGAAIVSWEVIEFY